MKVVEFPSREVQLRQEIPYGERAYTDLYELRGRIKAQDVWAQNEIKALNDRVNHLERMLLLFVDKGNFQK